jgi:hypothetical protein
MKASTRPTASKRRRSGDSGNPDPANPPSAPPVKMHQAMPPRLKRDGPPEAERRAFEDAVNGWWWL